MPSASSKPPEEMARLFRDAPEAIEETLRLSEQLTFSLDELRYEYPDETIDGFPDAQAALTHLAYEGAAKRYPQGVPDKVRAAIEHELALIAQLQYAPYFLTVYDIVRFARSQRHPLPGPRLGGQFRRLLLPRHHRGRSRPRRSPVRALHLAGAARAARHRRRFRARAARGGDPVHLRQIRPRARRHRRHRHLLSRPLGDPRGRQGLRPVRRHHRRAVVLDLGRRRRRCRGQDRYRPHRARRGQPAHAPDRARSPTRSTASRGISPSTSAASSSRAAGSTR